ncbi:M12 family metallo-peptidase [Hyphobacterium sp. HN65]|uniref:M12 family metallo-peptidase n=1 Tax=Hyphobacterium lacteum TaxID=3116575 RepID=A0ABU7LR36_9PROT|nr:M12 family metallo-peptidase [Hyphobacterium sp. HN65]MEE2526368.1 M12 family metallo-peptidase [Hyphobacterium sp. HN65]
MKTFCGLLLATVLVASAPMAAAQTSQAFTNLREQEQLSPQLRRDTAALSAQRGVGNVRVAQVSAAAIRDVPIGEELEIRVAPELSLSARALELEAGSGSRSIWRGEIAGTQGVPPGLATFVINGDSVTGSVRTPDGRLYRVRPLGNGETAIIELDYATLPRDHPPIEDGDNDDDGSEGGSDGGGGALEPNRPQIQPGQLRPLRQPALRNPEQIQRPRNPQIQRQIDPERLQLGQPALTRLELRYRDWANIIEQIQVPTIDVLVAYTDDAEAAAGDIDGLIDLAIAETNDSFRNSGIWARVRLVGTLNVTYNERNRDYYTMRRHLINRGDIYMARVHTRRNRTNADVVALIVDQDDYCGLAGDIGAAEEDAFVLVHWDCATGYYSFGHEIGHLLGARHDPDTDDTNTPYAFGHGYRYERNSGGWRTIMSYNCASNRCPSRLQYWSSPITQYNSITMGNSDQDNHRVWNLRADDVAAFR